MRELLALNQRKTRCHIFHWKGTEVTASFFLTYTCSGTRRGAAYDPATDAKSSHDPIWVMQFIDKLPPRRSFFRAGSYLSSCVSMLGALYENTKKSIPLTAFKGRFFARVSVQYMSIKQFCRHCCPAGGRRNSIILVVVVAEVGVRVAELVLRLLFRPWK